MSDTRIAVLIPHFGNGMVSVCRAIEHCKDGGTSTYQDDTGNVFSLWRAKHIKVENALVFKKKFKEAIEHQFRILMMLHEGLPKVIRPRFTYEKCYETAIRRVFYEFYNKQEGIAC